MTLTKEELQYDIDALKANIEKIKKNIGIFEEAIGKERKEIERLQVIIDVLVLDKQNAMKWTDGPRLW